MNRLLAALLELLPRITTRRNLAGLEAAVFELQTRLADVDPDAPRTCPAYGCCGCGAWMCDVITEPWEGAPGGEGYCWRCVHRKRIEQYLILPGRSPDWRRHNYFQQRGGW